MFSSVLLIALFTLLAPADRVSRPAVATGCSIGHESISPCVSTVTVNPDSSWSITYVITNTFTEADDITPSATLGGIASSCSSDPSDVVVPSGGYASFTETCTAIATGGTGTVYVHTNGISALTDTINVTVNAMSVLPNTSIKLAAAVTDTQAFTIQNLGLNSPSDTVVFSPSCSPYTCSMLETSPRRIANGASYTAHVVFTTGAAGSGGTTKLTAYFKAQTTSAASGTVTVAVPVPLAPTISTAPYNGDNRVPGLCVASCYDLSMAYSTPSYQSMGVARAATLVYTSAQARPMATIQVDAFDSSTFAANTFELQVRDAGAWITFRNGGLTALYFRQDTVGRQNRLAGQFDATGDSTGLRYDTATISGNWTTGGYAPATTSTSVTIPVLVLNEQGSYFGAGWSLAGLQRLRFPADTNSLVITDGAGGITRFKRSCQACIATAVAADFSTIVTVDSAGSHVRLVRRARDGSVAGFSMAGYLTYTTDRFADTTKYKYDGSNRIQYIIGPANDSLKFAYNGSGKLSTITDPGGRVTTFYIGAAGDLDSIYDVTNHATFKGLYPHNHLLTQRTDRAGNTWKYVYDFASKLVSDSTPSVTVDTTITGAGTLTTQRLGARLRSLESTELIDTASSYGSSSSPAPQRWSTKLYAVTFASTGDSTLYAVDRFGAPTWIYTPFTRDSSVITRDSADRVTAQVAWRRGKMLQSTSASFDGPRLSSANDFLAKSSVSYLYDTTFDVVKKVTGTTPTVRNYLNSAKSLIDSTRVGLNSDTTKDSVTYFKYDTHGRVIQVLDPKRDSTFTYWHPSGLQNVDSVRSGTRTVRYRSDSLGRVVRTVNPRGDSVRVAYDKLNRVDTTVAPNGTKTYVTYDSLGNVLTLTDAKGQVYSYHYNPLGWTDTLTDAVTSKNMADRKDAYEFTRSGAVRKHTDRNHVATTYVFDRLGRDSILTLGDGRQARFAYDPAGLWAADSNSESIDTVTTDTTKHTVTQVTWRGATRYVITAKSDTSGLLRSRKFTMGTDTTTKQLVSYGYDVDWRLDTMKVADSFVTAGRLTLFGYNADGMMTYRVLRGGSNGTTTIDSASYSVTATHQGYHVGHSAAGLGSYFELYTRDSLERVTQRTTALGDTAWTFAYDNLGQLTNWTTLYYSGDETCTPDPHLMDGEHCTGSSPTTVQSTTYSYDSVGNRTDGSPTLIAGNRLTAWNGYALTYDSAGNLHRKHSGTLDDTLFWNSIGQLDSVKVGTTKVSFGYDGMGRRVRKTVGAVVYKYIYDGDQILMIDSLGTRVKLFTNYPGVDQPHSVVLNTKARYYYLSESTAGSVWAMIDSMGAVKNSYHYAPYGTLVDSSETVKNNPYRYTGREYDPETQLYYYRARYYDPALGRFVSEDPSGENSGVNQYAYAEGNPASLRDPSGTDAITGTSSGPGCTDRGASTADGSCGTFPSGMGGAVTLGYSSAGTLQSNFDINVESDSAAAELAQRQNNEEYWREVLTLAESGQLNGMLRPDAEPQGEIYFFGFSDMWAIVAGTVSGHGTWNSTDGYSGTYTLSGKVDWGLGASVSLDFYGHAPAKAFFGQSDFICGSFLVPPIGYCDARNKNGQGWSVSVGVGAGAFHGVMDVEDDDDP